MRSIESHSGSTEGCSPAVAHSDWGERLPVAPGVLVIGAVEAVAELEGVGLAVAVECADGGHGWVWPSGELVGAGAPRRVAPTAGQLA